MTSKTAIPRLRYQPEAYDFVNEALRYAQRQVGRRRVDPSDEETHVTGQELLEGIRMLSIRQFGLMSLTVFHSWGVYTTEDFGRIVFELIEHGHMRKTDRDQLSDFFEVYDFGEVFDRDYRIDVSSAFRSS